MFSIGIATKSSRQYSADSVPYNVDETDFGNSGKERQHDDQLHCGNGIKGHCKVPSGYVVGLLNCILT